MKETEIAYAAGIIDSEGWIGFKNPGKNKGRPVVQVEIESCDEDMIDWMHSKCGGYKVNRPQRGNRKPSWGWRIGGQAAQEFLRTVLPFIIIKRQQDKIIEVLIAAKLS